MVKSVVVTVATVTKSKVYNIGSGPCEQEHNYSW